MTKPRAADAPEDRRSPIADPSRRLEAVVLDAAIPAIPHLLAMPLGVALRSATFIHASMWVGWATMAVCFVVDLVFLQRYGQTIGKRLLGLRTIRRDGTRASFGRLFGIRACLVSLIAMVPILGSLFTLVDALMIFTDERRTLHDRMADTIVVDLRAPLEIASTAAVFE